SDPTRDTAVRHAFAALSRTVGESPEETNQNGIIAGLGDMYYLLWSIERVATVYSQTLIGGKDWYAWGTRLLLTAQRVDGGWKGRFGTDIDTCFALMFLRRVDLARDLTGYLRTQGMEVALKTNTELSEKVTKALGEIDLGNEGKKQLNNSKSEPGGSDR